jgi:hypothetical protein
LGVAERSSNSFVGSASSDLLVVNFGDVEVGAMSRSVLNGGDT